MRVTLIVVSSVVKFYKVSIVFETNFWMDRERRCSKYYLDLGSCGCSSGPYFYPDLIFQQYVICVNNGDADDD